MVVSEKMIIASAAVCHHVSQHECKQMNHVKCHVTCKVLSCQKWHFSQSVIHQLEHRLISLRVPRESGIVRCDASHRHRHGATKARLKRTVREVIPVQEVRVVLLAGFHEQVPVAMDVDDVFEAGFCLGEFDSAIVLDYRCSAKGMQFLELGGRKDGRAVVFLELVVDSEFFAEEDNPIGLGMPKMVNCENHCEQFTVS